MLLWTLILLLVVITYAILVVWVLPKYLLKSKYPMTTPTDRGLKKYKFNDDDYAVVYEPSLSERKYVTQYVLAKKDGKKTIKCKIAHEVTYIDFDIALFNAHGECFNVMHSMDIVPNDGLVPEITLPNETSYASIIVNQVNDKVLRTTQEAEISKRHLLIFGGTTMALSIGLSICSMLAFSNIFGGLFRETFAEKMFSTGWVFLIPTLICATCITGACYMLFSKNSKR